MKPDHNTPQERMTMKNQPAEVGLFKGRAAVAGGFIVFAFTLLVLRYGWLQLMQHETYVTQSENNRIHLEAIAPPRGFIYDRNGVLLADNRPIFALVINRQQVSDLDETIKRLVPVINLMPEEIERFKKRLRVSRRYELVPIRSRLSEEDLASFTEKRYLFPGVSAENDISRYYPQGELFAHVLGYVSRISEQDQKNLDATAYAGTNLIGKLGIEKYYESVLHGKVGYQHVETNAFGRQIRVLKRTPPQRGTDLKLSLDIQLQQLAHEQLAGRRGAIVALDPRDGSVLAFVSNPGFDPNLFVGGIPSSLYNGLRDHIDRPLYNRALQGVYPPGSTIKPFEALGGLHYGLVDWDYTISDPGYFMLPGVNHRFRDWKKQGHGRVNMVTSIEQSCDTYYYQLSDRMGVDRFHDWMAEFGFGKETGIDLVNERTGTLPSVAWKRKRLNAPWYRGEMMSVGIGQGYFTATPLQIALATAIVANGGHRIRPHVLRSSSDPTFQPDLPKPDLIPYNGQPEDWDKMHFAMREVIHGARGTASRLRIGLEGYDIAGKTGTAQVKGIKQGERYDESKLDERHYDHAWFMGFAPVTNPVIAVAVLVENGKHGSSTAAPIARVLFDYEINRTLPPPPKVVPEDAGE